MIVVDSSAIIAIAFEEKEAEVLTEFLASVNFLIAAPTLLEIHMVLEGRPGRSAKAFMSTFLPNSRVSIVSFDFELSEIARAAFDRYGKGRHPAKLNFGDCISYALAKARGLPLLFKGGDFALTDIRRALPA